MNKKIFIPLFIILILAIGYLCYLIYTIKPIDDYVTFEDNSSFFFNLTDNGNEVILTYYSTGGLISAEEIYTFENNTLKHLKRINHSNNIMQAKINVKTNTYPNTTATRDKNRVIYDYTEHDMYGKTKEEVINSLNEFIKIVPNTNNEN